MMQQYLQFDPPSWDDPARFHIAVSGLPHVVDYTPNKFALSDLKVSHLEFRGPVQGVSETGYQSAFIYLPIEGYTAPDEYVQAYADWLFAERWQKKPRRLLSILEVEECHS